MEVKIKKLHPSAELPLRASEYAGGWDVTVTEIEKHDDLVICKLGFALQPPKGYKVTLVPRSSLTKTKWIMQNSPGLGDSDYTGEYQVRFRALPENTSRNYKPFIYPKFPFNVGDRIAQMYLEEVIPIEFLEVEELDSTNRGEGGFGSTNN